MHDDLDGRVQRGPGNRCACSPNMGKPCNQDTCNPGTFDCAGKACINTQQKTCPGDQKCNAGKCGCPADKPKACAGNRCLAQDACCDNCSGCTTCQGGTCKPRESCNAQELRCNGQTIQVCSTVAGCGAWGDLTRCPSGCGKVGGGISCCEGCTVGERRDCDKFTNQCDECVTNAGCTFWLRR